MKKELFEIAAKLQRSINNCKIEIASRKKTIERIKTKELKLPRWCVTIQDPQFEERHDITAYAEMQEDTVINGLKAEIKEIEAIQRKAQNEFNKLK